MQVHILLKKLVQFQTELVPLASVELEVVPKGLYVIEGVTYQTVGIPKFFLDKLSSGNHYLLYVEIIVEPESTGI